MSGAQTSQSAAGQTFLSAGEARFNFQRWVAHPGEARVGREAKRSSDRTAFTLQRNSRRASARNVCHGQPAVGCPCEPLETTVSKSARAAHCCLLALILSFSLIAADEPAPAIPKDSVPTVDKEAAAKAYQRGVDYLVHSQNKDGSWGSFESARPDQVMLGTSASYQAFGDGSSALCILALLKPSHDRKDALNAVENAIQYFIKTPPASRADATCFYNVWAHIYVLEALSAVLLDERFKDQHSEVKKIAELHLGCLKKIQGSEGGFGYYDFHFAGPHPTGSESTSFNNAAALLALERAKAAGIDVPEQMTSDALRSLQRMRIGTGAYIYGTYIEKAPQHLANQVKGSLGRSQACNLALLHYKAAGVTAENLKTGLQNLFDFHHFIEIGKGRPIPHEAWYFTAGYYFHFGHYYAARCARELPEPDRQKFLDGLAATMVRLQDVDGSWWDFPLYGYYKAYGTAFALMTME